MDELMNRIELTNDEGIATFITLNNTNIYLVYNWYTTTLQYLIDKFNESYDLNNIKSMGNPIIHYKTDENITVKNDDLKHLVKNVFSKNFKLKLYLEYPQPLVINNAKSNIKVFDPVKYDFDSFQIFCKGLTGKIETINVSNNLTTNDLSQMIYERTAIKPSDQRLIYNGYDILYDSKTLGELGIVKESTVHLVCRLRGGMYMESSSKTDYIPLKSCVIWVNVDKKFDL